MHEGQFTDKIVDVILNELKNHPNGKINNVRVKVGEVYHLELESVLMHYAIAVKGSRLENVALDIREEPVNVECQVCKKVGPVEDHHLLFCSFCNAMNVKTVSGNSIIVESIEIEA